MNEFMHLAIKEAKEGIYHHDGGPFGSVIVKDGKAIACAHNCVLLNNDPTAHGEVMAIRKACEILKTHDLTGCQIYTTGEPCPMCLCACKWANIDKIYYGCTIKDNEMIGFRDNKFDKFIKNKRQKNKYLCMQDRDACLKLFEEYQNMDKEIY